MDAITFNSTAMLRKHFGLVEDGKNVYKKQIDINGNNKFEDDELIDANENGAIEDKEVWEFLARHVLSPNIQEFIKQEDFIGTVIKDLENLPENSQSEIRALAQEIIYKNFAYKSELSYPRAETSPAIKLKLPAFFSALWLEVGWGGSADIPIPSYEATLKNLPYPARADKCCVRWCDTYTDEIGAADMSLELGLFISDVFSLLDLEAGLELGSEEVYGDKSSSSKVVRPFLEARIPLYTDEGSSYGLFIKYPFRSMSQKIMADAMNGDDYAVGRINVPFRLKTGFVWKGGIGREFAILLRIGPYLVFQKATVVKEDLPDLENNVNIHLKYPWLEWGFECSFLIDISLRRWR